MNLPNLRAFARRAADRVERFYWRLRVGTNDLFSRGTMDTRSNRCRFGAMTRQAAVRVPLHGWPGAAHREKPISHTGIFDAFDLSFACCSSQRPDQHSGGQRIHLVSNGLDRWHLRGGAGGQPDP